jgi:hypothetical protein
VKQLPIWQSIELDVINVKKTFVQHAESILITLEKHANNLRNLKTQENVDFVV